MALIKDKFPCPTESAARMFQPPNAAAGIQTHVSRVAPRLGNF